MTRLFGVMIQLDNGRFIALIIASFRRNLWTHFYDSGQYTEIETRARLLHLKSEVYCYCGKKANLGHGLNYCLGFCIGIVFLNFSFFLFSNPVTFSEYVGLVRTVYYPKYA